MGCGSSRPVQVPTQNMVDHWFTLCDVHVSMRKAGLERCSLEFGISFARSNLTNGTQTFSGRSLHYIDPTCMLRNPYEQVIALTERVLHPFSEHNNAFAFGFGEESTSETGLLNISDRLGCPCNEILQRYRDIAPTAQYGAAVSLAPLINNAIKLVEASQQFHVLVIVCDTQITHVKQTIDAIVRAAQYPLSIVMVGVGDGPWDRMKEFVDILPNRLLDNFRFVNFHEQCASGRDVAFATAAFSHLPEQYLDARRHGMLLRQSTTEIPCHGACKIDARRHTPIVTGF
eukprot:TRINITY_DN1303_c0_g3_i2.p1 TRINITY_DN1303_c0_g3~~TRINITY_DN1303_c0_g3_i2.p1  ORF type:complete len:287 (-),score=31.20 TRINITY_DN1303_c0_g3_i2:10-870(-)